MIKALTIAASLFMMVQCAADQSGEVNQERSGNEDSSAASEVNVRGSWKIMMFQPFDHSFSLAPQIYTKSVQSNVPLSVQFDISDQEFNPPTDPVEGIISFGKFVVTKLRDNHLKVCGPEKNQKCQKAQLRMYTSGTGGAGYWNDEEQYGLPIMSGPVTIPLGDTERAIMSEVDLQGIRVLRLRHFNDAAKDFPVSIDFSEAALGSYKTEINIEYVLR